MEKVNKRQALSAFEHGHNIYIEPYKMRPEFYVNVFDEPIQQNLEHLKKYKCLDEKEAIKQTFETLINSTKYYNCNDETGNRLAYCIDK